MGTAKVAITIDADLLQRIDRLVAERRFPSCSRAIQLAVKAQIDRLDHTRLARECANASARLPKPSWVRVSQIRTLSIERLTKRIGHVSPEELQRVVDGLNEIIAT